MFRNEKDQVIRKNRFSLKKKLAKYINTFLMRQTNYKEK